MMVRVESFRPASRGAAILLLVLLGHLAFMVSPLHGVALDAHGFSFSSGDVTHGHNASGATPVESDLAQSDDCDVTSAPPSRPFLVTISNLGPLVLARPAIDAAASLNPWPRAHGPPKKLDTQAVLQVFLN